MTWSDEIRQAREAKRSAFVWESYRIVVADENCLLYGVNSGARVVRCCVLCWVRCSFLVSIGAELPEESIQVV